MTKDKNNRSNEGSFDEVTVHPDKEVTAIDEFPPTDNDRTTTEGSDDE